MNISLDQKMTQYWFSMNYYSIQSAEKFVKYFFPDELKVKIDDNNFNTRLHDIQLDTDLKYDRKLHIMICVENCSVHTWYKHYNKYGNYNNPYIQIYLYNHISTIEETERYIAIPVIYCQINYYIKNNELIKPSILTPFKEKKFCIILTPNNFREKEKSKIIDFLSKLGRCDSLNIYKQSIMNKSCYHSDELLNIIQLYKFAFVCENSLNDGYITEKIFNCFFGSCIPIYNGSKIINQFINCESFINVNDIDNIHDKEIEIKRLSEDENLFQKKVNFEKISNQFSDEDYTNRLIKFIDMKFNKVNLYLC